MAMMKSKGFKGFVGCVAVAAIAVGCGQSSGDANDAGTGGGPASGGQTSTGAAPGAGGSKVVSVECTTSNVEPCGGDLAGEWNVAASCLELQGDMDVSITSLGCLTVPVAGMLEVSGSFSVAADGTYVDSTQTTGAVEFPVAQSCLTVSSVVVECADLGTLFEAMGWATAQCADVAGACTCNLTADQSAGLGAVVLFTEPEGTLKTGADTFTMATEVYSYCAEGDVLTVTPQMSGLVGQMILLRDGTTAASGGASGAGGALNTGGGTGSGGTNTGGGNSGGAPAAGGGLNTGGASGGGPSGGGSNGSGGEGTGGGATVSDKPCDIYGASGTACVAAHSTVRALFKDYAGPLYQVKRADGQFKDIPVLSAGGYADSAVQDSFCNGSNCTIWKLYDQSGHDTFLEAQTNGSTVGGNTGMTAANATAEKITAGGHLVYSLFTRPNQAYWSDGSQKGMPLGAEPQGIYMVTSGVHYNGACCYNYGNGQLNRKYNGGPQMDSIYFGDSTQWGNGSGPGPWVMADMEDGMLAGGNGDNPSNTSLAFTFVTAMEKNNGTDAFALKGGDATQGTITTMWDGALPNSKRPMKKQGSVLLGAGGDCCLTNNNLSEGTFYEGAIVAGYPSSATDQAIQAAIVEARYGQ